MRNVHPKRVGGAGLELVTSSSDLRAVLSQYSKRDPFLFLIVTLSTRLRNALLVQVTRRWRERIVSGGRLSYYLLLAEARLYAKRRILKSKGRVRRHLGTIRLVFSASAS
jgi:hypothetical protein